MLTHWIIGTSQALHGLTAAGLIGVAGTVDIRGIGSTSSNDGFVTKLNSSGAPLWFLVARVIGGSGSDLLGRNTVDSAGNIYLSGTYDSALASPTSLALAAAGQDAFVMKLGTNGSYS